MMMMTMPADLDVLCEWELPFVQVECIWWRNRNIKSGTFLDNIDAHNWMTYTIFKLISKTSERSEIKQKEKV